MVNWRSAIMIAVMLVFTATPVLAESGERLLREDFSLEIAGEFPLFNWTPNRGDVSDAFRVIHDPEFSEGNVLRAFAGAQGTEGYILSPSFRASGTRIRVTFSYKLDPSEGDRGSFYLFEAGAVWPPYITMFITKDGIEHHGTVDGRLQSVKIPADIDAERFNHIAAEIDFAKSTVRYTVNGVTLDELLPLRREGDGGRIPMQVGIFWRPGEVSGYWKDFEVTQLD